MAAVKTYNFKPHKTNDTFEGVGFQVIVNNSPRTLVGAVINMTIVGEDTVVFSTTTEELVITDGAAAKFKLKKQIITLPPRKHDYKITIIYADGDVKTYIIGTWQILP
jgi:hypothetical protein